MPVPPVPYVHPNEVTFSTTLSLPQKQNFCIFNPFPQDILFKVDCPAKQALASPTQGVVSSRKKINIELTCTSWVSPQEHGVQVRFFKWAKPRHGHKGGAQQYVGFREVKIGLNAAGSERERTPSEWGSVSYMGGVSTRGPIEPSQGSNSGTPFSDAGSSVGDAQRERKVQVVSNIILALVLLLCGVILDQASERWFATHIIESIKPHTLAIISYTLAGVIIVSLLTLR